MYNTAMDTSEMKHTLIIVAAVLGLGAAGTGWGAQQMGCIIEPERVAEVGSPVIGVIESVLVERGDYVRKGQALALLRREIERASLVVAKSRAAAEAEVMAATANHEFALKRRQRAEDLHKKAFISAQALDQAVAEADVAHQKLVQAREQQSILNDELSLAKVRMEERTIRSPFDGIVAERYFSAGERIEERPLARVVKVDPLRVEVVVPGALFGNIVNGSEAEVTPDLQGAVPVRTKVTLVDKVLDAPSNTFRVRLTLPNPGGVLPAGMRCKVEFAAVAGKAPKAANLAPAKLGDVPAEGIMPLKIDMALSPQRMSGDKQRNM